MVFLKILPWWVFPVQSHINISLATCIIYLLYHYIDPPVITNHPTDNIVPLGKSVTLMCSGCGMGTLKYFWERSSGSSWSTVSNNNVLHTTNTTLAIGQYMYRCRVGNEAGSVVSDNGAVTVYGEFECCPIM